MDVTPHEDAFYIYTHFLDSSFHLHHVHVSMLRCQNSDGTGLAKQLKAIIEKLKIDSKVIFCVSDGGSNMRTCMGVLDTHILISLAVLHSKASFCTQAFSCVQARSQY